MTLFTDCRFCHLVLWHRFDRCLGHVCTDLILFLIDSFNVNVNMTSCANSKSGMCVLRDIFNGLFIDIGYKALIILLKGPINIAVDMTLCTNCDFCMNVLCIFNGSSKYLHKHSKYFYFSNSKSWLVLYLLILKEYEFVDKGHCPIGS